MDEWTRDRVEERLFEAAGVMRRLPEVRVQGYYSLWPAMAVEFADLVGQEAPRLKRPPPMADAITRMETALTWLRWLDPEDAKLVWARADGARWKAICWRFGIARATANRRWEYALSVIVWRLNRRPIPTKWSREFLVERVRASSRIF